MMYEAGSPAWARSAAEKGLDCGVGQGMCRVYSRLGLLGSKRESVNYGREASIMREYIIIENLYMAHQVSDITLLCI